ncbi:MAG TPA: hypothetical protein VL442_18555 [Mucilaginibacter sp.]|jgi:hypothetical protein|nr:hypothetical protein [Mucilaginibacter sp.]
MKKMLLVLCVAIIAMNGKSQSLNGYSQNDVKAMIAPFNKLYTQPSQITSVWFDKNIIENMVDLLNYEVKTRGSKAPDGVRIYFAYDNSHNETVVLVSTRNSFSPNPKSQEQDTYHWDYYDHPSNAALFNMKLPDGTPYPINGKQCHDRSCSNGAQLYVTSNAPDDTSCDGAHYLTRAECEQMVQEYANKPHNISTKAAWFDLDLLNEFADAMKKNQNLDGLRIYFAKHTQNDQTYYPGEDAFVLVPTQTNTDVSPAIPAQDYFNCSITNKYFKSHQSGLRTIIIQPKKGVHNLGKGAAHYTKTQLVFKPFANGGGQDNAELCPDNCN